ncbi:MAG: helix-turn-helix domain-containing protein, partial [Synergistaceae bacterium]|nr:helix-turn-helix domain-containing protein [Synergistaceae bacterium]
MFYAIISNVKLKVVKKYLLIYRAYKFRVYPNAEQKIMFAKTFGCVRFIYNRMLADKIKYYK